MSTLLAERVQLYPDEAVAAFSRVDAAFNLVLPGSDTHKRYRDIGEVGLAVVVAQDLVLPDSYNPFDPASLERVLFTADNRLAHPDAWAPQDRDEGILGGAVPDGMGRFIAFALAKLNGLIDNEDEMSSVRTDTVSVAKGKVGLAGGQRLGGALLSKSGLWEVHDHVAGQVYADDLALLAKGDNRRTIDDLAGEVDEIVDRIKGFHIGEEAADLDRRMINILVRLSDGVMQDLREQRGWDDL